MADESKAKVLIVDDVPANIRILGQAIRDHYEVLIATDGGKALEIAFGESPPDLILLDIIMPEMDGYEVCRRIKENPATANIPIIFITSKSEEEDEAKGFEAGGVDYIGKPFSLPIVKARVRTHVALKRQQDELRALNETKNRFLGTAAHDLRNPLAAIRGLTEIMLEGATGPVPEEQEEMLQMVFNTSDHMLALVNDLLDVAVIESGKFDLSLEEEDIEKLVADRLRILKPSAAKKDIRIETEFEPTPNCLLDGQRIVQVFDNLFTNAVKFSPAGSTIWIRIREKSGKVHLEVADEGPGISEENQKRLFGEFQRLGTKPTGGESSTGLGLSIVNRIVKAHGGEVRVESVIGSGTTMTAVFPVQD